MDRYRHWEQVYQTRRPEQLSWFQAEATLSLATILSVAPDRTSRILDVGAGVSPLVDGLLAAGYGDVTILDVSPSAIASSRQRLGETAASVTWIEADLLEAALPERGFDLWHDRAVFHFLTDPADRARYVAQVRHAVRPGGHLLVATFAEDGPTRCSGLEVVRYSPAGLQAAFGPEFRQIAARHELHTTPSGVEQPFTYGLFRLDPSS